MSVADKYFKDAVNKILTEGVSDEAFAVRPKWPDGTPAHTRKIHCYVARYNLAEEFPAEKLYTPFSKTHEDFSVSKYVKSSKGIFKVKS